MKPPAESRRIEAIAFGALVLACYSQFLTSRRIDAEAWRLGVAFALGAVYTVLFLAIPREPRTALRTGLFVGSQCALLTVLLSVSPMDGFFILIVLPTASQTIFLVGRRTAAGVILYLYALCLAVIGYRYGIQAILGSSVTMLAAFAFAISFTLLTVRANDAKARSEQLREELEEAHRKLQDQATRMEELATIRERNRLAREIHDGVGHYLTVIKVQLDAATALLAQDPARAADSVDKASRLAGEALDDVRRSVRALAGLQTPAPLVDSLRELARDGTPAPELRIEGTPRPLPHATTHALYRSAQEGLTNIRKHAGATTATLVVDFRGPDRVRLVLTDNGCGVADEDAGRGFGLRGLQERIALLGGSVTAANRSEGGFVLTIDVPA